MKALLSILCVAVLAASAPAQNFERLVALENKVEKLEADFNARLAALEGKPKAMAEAAHETGVRRQFFDGVWYTRFTDGSFHYCVPCNNQRFPAGRPTDYPDVIPAASKASSNFTQSESASDDGSQQYSAGPSYHVAPGSPSNGIPRYVCSENGGGFTNYRAPVRRLIFGR